MAGKDSPSFCRSPLPEIISLVVKKIIFYGVSCSCQMLAWILEFGSGSPSLRQHHVKYFFAFCCGFRVSGFTRRSLIHSEVVFNISVKSCYLYLYLGFWFCPNDPHVISVVVPYRFQYYHSVKYVEIWKGNPSSIDLFYLFIFAQNTFGYLESFVVPYEL